jgi:hypothetical protein
MKGRLLTLIAFAGIFAACSKDITFDPAVSLFAPQPEVYEETAIFRLASMSVDTTYEQSFPVTFGGSAELGVDYEVSGDRFILGGENPVDSIVVTTLKLGTDKTVSLTVELPEGVGAGKYLTSEFTLQDKLAYFSFPASYSMVTDSVEVEFNAYDRKGKTKALSNETMITLSVDAEKSTAVEGEDFVFADSAHFVITQGRSAGKLKLKALKPRPAEGRDKIVLNLGFSEKYGAGAEGQLEINLLDTLWNTLNGEWKIDTLVTDAAYMSQYWGETCTGFELIPEYNKSDAVDFDLNAGSFNPKFRSGFKNCFLGKSVIRKAGQMDLDLGNGETASLQTFLLDNTNRDFSAGSKSEDKESYIGLRILEGEEKDTLDFYVIDYQSTSFMPELATDGKYAPEKPVAASPGLFLNLTFTK